MGLKEKCKLASRVLKTQVPYQSWALKTRFLLAEFAELDMFMPHGSWVFNSRVQKNINLEFFALDFKLIKKNVQTPGKKKRFQIDNKKSTNPKKKKIRKKEKKKRRRRRKRKRKNREERRKPRWKKERRRRSTTKGLVFVVFSCGHCLLFVVLVCIEKGLVAFWVLKGWTFARDWWVLGWFLIRAFISKVRYVCGVVFRRYALELEFEFHVEFLLTSAVSELWDSNF